MNSGDVVDGGGWGLSSDGISRPKSNQTKDKKLPNKAGCSGFSRGTSANMLGTRVLCHAIQSINQAPWNNLLLALESSGIDFATKRVIRSLTSAQGVIAL